MRASGGNFELATVASGVVVVSEPVVMRTATEAGLLGSSKTKLPFAIRMAGVAASAAAAAAATAASSKRTRTTTNLAAIVRFIRVDKYKQMPC